MRLLTYSNKPLLSSRNVWDMLSPEMDPFLTNVFPFRRQSDRLASSPWNADYEVSETDSAYKLYVDLPGVKREDIEIQVEEDLLTITAKRRRLSAALETEEKQAEEPLSIKKSFRLPENVDAESIDAGHEDGVLMLTIPKPEEVLPRKVKIAIGEGK